jgi:hypothetical protein
LSSGLLVIFTDKEAVRKTARLQDRKTARPQDRKTKKAILLDGFLIIIGLS